MHWADKIRGSAAGNEIRERDGGTKMLTNGQRMMRTD